MINVTLPVLNEQAKLEEGVCRLLEFLKRKCEFPYEIVIAENGSSDRTYEIASSLSKRFSEVRVLQIGERGRGRALKRSWLETDADVLSYMDIDLSTDLFAFPHLIEALLQGGFDVATGSRLLNPSLTTRSIKREFISRTYNLLVRTVFRTRFSDAQCGFKAISRKAAQYLLPLTHDNGWFFDTELLVLAEEYGFRIFDLPVRWTENRDSRVRIWSTALADIMGIIRVRSAIKRRGQLGMRKLAHLDLAK